MNRKKFLLNSMLIVVTFIALLFSLFKFNHPIAIAAWITPIFFMRFMRKNKWSIAITSSFIMLLVTMVFGYFLPLIPMVEEQTSILMSKSSLFIMFWKKGVIFAPFSILLPFILDKILHKQLPSFLASLIYPSAVVTIEFTTVVMNTFGDTQFTIAPIVMIASIFGVYGISFFVAWFASIINIVWENEWKIKSLGRIGIIYGSILSLVLIYTSTCILNFDYDNQKTIPIAGITTNSVAMNFEEEIYFDELYNMPADEFAKKMSSKQSELDNIYIKTVDAINAGAKLVIWQEMAVFMESSVGDKYIKKIQELANKNDVYILVSYFRILSEEERINSITNNLGVLCMPNGEIGWEYEKYILSSGFEDFMNAPGPGEIVFVDTPYGRIGQVICADLTESEYIRQAGEKEIDVLIVPGLDAKPYSPLFSLASTYRAVENGFTIVRVAGDGYSVIIDPYYRSWTMHDTYLQGNANFYCNAPVITKKTIYSSIGYIFPYVICVLLFVLITVTIIKIKTKVKR